MIKIYRILTCLNLSSTIGYGYFAPYYPITHHPCSTPIFSFNCISVQLLLYTSSAAMVYRRYHLFGHPFHIYIEGLVPYRINRVLILLIRFNRREGGAARRGELVEADILAG